jgi:prevent-host-death family protein
VPRADRSGALDLDGLIRPDVPMRRVKIAELKDHLSEHLRAVERGAELEVTDRERPIVRLVPVSETAAPAILPARRPFSGIRSKRYGPAGWRASSLELLREERARR